MQHDQLDRLAQALPLPQLQLPFVFAAALDAGGLTALADALISGIEGLPA